MSKLITENDLKAILETMGGVATSQGTSGLLITINTTTSGSTTTLSFDKTAQEIKDCLDSGVMPVLKYGNEYSPIADATISSSYQFATNLLIAGAGNPTFSCSSATAYPYYTYTTGGSND